MSLAILLPFDYRQPAVLVTFSGDGRMTVPARSDEEASRYLTAVRSFSEHGGVSLPLHRSDETPRLGRRAPHGDYF